MDRTFNHYLMEIGREARGHTQAELCELLCVGQGTVSKYENGLLDPPDPFVVALGQALRFPPEFFRQPARILGFPPFHYRKRKALSRRVTARINAEMNIRRLHVAALSKSFNARVATRIPQYDPDEFHRSVASVARLVREAWMLPRGPVADLTAAIEAAGGVVIPCDFGTDQIDAISQRVDGLPVLFFINNASPSDRLRHTLAHELGHMVMHTLVPDEDAKMEEEADMFAGCFLLPEDEIRPQLRPFGLPRLANLKAHWGVSIAALAVRADRLRLLTPHQYKAFWVEYNKQGYRYGEPVEVPRERPSLLRRMVEFHLTELGYSVAELARLLCLLPDEFADLYLERPRLRLVV